MHPLLKCGVPRSMSYAKIYLCSSRRLYNTFSIVQTVQVILLCTYSTEETVFLCAPSLQVGCWYIIQELHSAWERSSLSYINHSAVATTDFGHDYRRASSVLSAGGEVNSSNYQ